MATFARRATRDFRIQALNDAARRGEPLEEDYYVIYNLRWKDLRAWLEKRFDGLKQPSEPELADDYYIFLVPKGKRLTQDEQDEIRKLKYPSDQAPAPRAKSPE